MCRKKKGPCNSCSAVTRTMANVLITFATQEVRVVLDLHIANI